MSFADLGLTPELLRAVAAEGYTEPTPVQAEAIPLVLAGRDVLAGAQTGTGKTAAFVLPMLQLLHGSRPQPNLAPAGNGRPRGATGLPIRALVLTPTRELALQVEESVRTYGRQRPVRSTAIYGGVGYENQVRALRGGLEIVVATPGRLLDHVGQRTIDLSHVQILVLDEADRMLDMGFIRDIRKVLAILPPQRQNLLFSATFSDEIRELASGLLHDPAFVQIARRNAPIELVRQVVHPVDRERKRDLLVHLIRSGRIDQALVFTRTKHGANRLAEQLGRDGITAAAIHGNKSQGQRVRALDDFKSGRVPILVATEVAARGLDIEGLPHVVNYELPMVPEDYVHRIGRTGRAGLNGDAVSLVCVDELPLLRDIEKLLKTRVPEEIVDGFAPDRSARPEPIRLRSATPRPAPARPGSTRGRGRPHGAPAAPTGFAPARRPGGESATRMGSATPATAGQGASSNGLPPRRTRIDGGQPTGNGAPTPPRVRPGESRGDRRPTQGQSAPQRGPARSDGRQGQPANQLSAARPDHRGASNGRRPDRADRNVRPDQPARGTSIGNGPMPLANRGSQRTHHARPQHSPATRGEVRALPGERLARFGSRQP
jgi:ATP-dependent RNA helicase RhlE